MAGVRIYLNSYGSPGDTEKKDCSIPTSLTEWKTLAKEATKEDGAGFVEVEEKPTGGQNSPIKALVNVNQVEWVVQL
jgi:hypothetical protein